MPVFLSGPSGLWGPVPMLGGASCSVHCVPLEISEWELPTDMSLHMVPWQGSLDFYLTESVILVIFFFS